MKLSATDIFCAKAQC